MITVLAGVNGAGKSSIGGSALRSQGQDWYNPDTVARELQIRFPDKPIEEINSKVWMAGVRRLEHAIKNDHHFAFETTLGGKTVTNKLLDAIAMGVSVSVWFCGLESVALHIERVAARVARGGHDIPSALIQERFVKSISNLRRLAPGLHQLAVFDNSLPLNANRKPQLRKLIQVQHGQLSYYAPTMPNWAKSVAMVCMTHFGPNKA